MTLHIFNPEHEHAMAADIWNFTPPHAAREVRSRWSYLPALWAEDGDVVIVDDIQAAQNAYRKLKLRRRPEIAFTTLKELHGLLAEREVTEVEPWGWDKTIKRALIRAGVPETAMPDDAAIERIRALSNRSTAVEMLAWLRQSDREGWLTGHADTCHDMAEVEQFIGQHGDVVLKAPWSCSGRGVRYVTTDTFTDNVRKWTDRTLRLQHTVVAEVKCHKVLDFAVEFMAGRDGTVGVMGLSLFDTVNGAYKGNLVVSEQEKRERVGRYIPMERLDEVTGQIARFLGPKLAETYHGPFGVDMMVVDGSLLNPCVEINLRRTMGHVALAKYERLVTAMPTNN